MVNSIEGFLDIVSMVTPTIPPMTRSPVSIFNSKPTSHDFCPLLLSSAYIANNMDPYQTAPKGAV